MLYMYRMSSPPSGNAAPEVPGLVAVAAGFGPVDSGFAGCWPNVPWSQVSCSGVKGGGVGCCPVGSVIALEPFLPKLGVGRERAAESNCSTAFEATNVVKVTL